MSNIKLVHSGGNSVSLTTPDSNPSGKSYFQTTWCRRDIWASFVTDGSWCTLICKYANCPTTAGGTMTIGFQDHTSGNVSSTTATGYYQRIGNMVWGAVDTGSVNTSILQYGQILLLTGCFPITRDNNWQVVGSCYHYYVNTNQNSGGSSIYPAKGYWLSKHFYVFCNSKSNSYLKII